MGKCWYGQDDDRSGYKVGQTYWCRWLHRRVTLILYLYIYAVANSNIMSSTLNCYCVMPQYVISNCVDYLCLYVQFNQVITDISIILLAWRPQTELSIANIMYFGHFSLLSLVQNHKTKWIHNFIFFCNIY